MVTRRQFIRTSSDRIFTVLADGWTYASWVVGASHIRDVDGDWPAAGARLHHQVGPWPLHIRDVTSVRAVVPGRMLELHAKAWPLGAARVQLDLQPVDGGTHVTLAYDVVEGVGRHIPRPIKALLLGPRSAEMLSRLSDIAIRRTVPAVH